MRRLPAINLSHWEQHIISFLHKLTMHDCWSVKLITNEMFGFNHKDIILKRIWYLSIYSGASEEFEAPPNIDRHYVHHWMLVDT